MTEITIDQFDGRSAQCCHCRKVVSFAETKDHWRSCSGPHPAKVEIDERDIQITELTSQFERAEKDAYELREANRLLVADNAALLKFIQDDAVTIDREGSYCSVCDRDYRPIKDPTEFKHDSKCILYGKHPSTQLLADIAVKDARIAELEQKEGWLHHEIGGIKNERDDLAASWAAIIDIARKHLQEAGTFIAGLNFSQAIRKAVNDPPAAAKALLKKIQSLESEIQAMRDCYTVKLIKDQSTEIGNANVELARRQQFMDELQTEGERRQGVIDELGRDLLERQRMQSEQAEEIDKLRGALEEIAGCSPYTPQSIARKALAAKPAPEQGKETPNEPAA